MARRLVVVGLIVAAVAGAAYGVWFYQYSRRHVWTDAASIEGHVVTVSARVAGPVARVLVRDNEDVREGQVLVEIDPRDYEIRVDQARAAVAMAAADERGARMEVPITRDTAANRIDQMRASTEASRVVVEASRAQVDEVRARLEGRRAAVLVAQAEVVVAETTTDKTRMDLDRMSRLVASDLVSRQDHDTAQIAHRATLGSLEAARRRLSQAEREIEQVVAELRSKALLVEQAQRRLEEAQALLAEAGSQRAQVPVKEAGAGRALAALQQARADLAAAELQLAKTRIRAAMDGTVSKRTVEPGQLIQPGQPLLAIVPLQGIWVLANFKETQLAYLRPGQRATITVDTFPDRVFQGRVESISAGTGSRFSLLPPENATGNWVKVVQRVPVKIVLESRDLANPHALRAGMSAFVTIRLR